MASYFENGVFTEGKAAWHGAGIVLPDESLTVERVFELVPELASDVKQVPMFLGSIDPGPIGQTPQYPLVQLPDHFANVRVLDGKPLGVVGHRYRILQNRDAFEFVSDIVDSGQAIIKTAGTLRGGSTIWFLCQIPDEIVVGGLDTERIQTYLLISNSHDGSSAVTVAIVHVRVVCTNTLTAALSGAPRTYKIRHTASVDGKVAAARDALGIAFKQTEKLSEVGQKLLNSSFSDEQFDEFLQQLVPDQKAKDGSLSKNPPRVRAQIKHGYFNVPDLSDIRGTRWGAVQSVAQWADHKATFKSSRTSRAAENRFSSLTGGSNITSKAFDLVLS